MNHKVYMKSLHTLSLAQQTQKQCREIHEHHTAHLDKAVYSNVSAWHIKIIANTVFTTPLYMYCFTCQCRSAITCLRGARLSSGHATHNGPVDLVVSEGQVPLEKLWTKSFCTQLVSIYFISSLQFALWIYIYIFSTWKKNKSSLHASIVEMTQYSVTSHSKLF